MKIYFAGSIRGGREDSELYLEIINILKDYGEVLTEHIGDKNISSYGEIKPPQFIHDRDVEWLNESDVVVAEVTTPSLGVGYELGIAESIGKKVLCLFRESSGKSLSAMVIGNNKFKVENYKESKDLKDIFNKFFEE